MKTARYYGIEDIRYEELPVPNCGEKDVTHQGRLREDGGSIYML